MGCSRRRLVLPVLALLGAAQGHALEPMADADLSDASGQAGLTVLMSDLSVKASSVRYYDKDGMSATGVTAYDFAGNPVYLTADGTSTGTPSPGPCGGMKNLDCANSYGVAAGSLNFNGFSVEADSLMTTLDVGSNNTSSGAFLVLGMQFSNLDINLGGISMDNGNETGAATATNAAVYNASGDLTSGNDLGGVAITNGSLSNFVLQVKSGASTLGTNSGLTFTSMGQTNAQFNFVYFNTTMQHYNGGGTFAPAAGHAANDGLMVIPIYIRGLDLGSIEIAAGDSGGGYTSSSSQGLDIAFSGITIDTLDFGAEGFGASGIQIAGTDFGSIALLGVHVAPMVVSINGH